MSISDQDIDRISEAIASKTKLTHMCIFEEQQVKTINRFTDALANGNWAKFQAIMDFGAGLIVFKKTASVTLFTTMVTGVLMLLVLGIRSWVLSAGGAGQ